VSGSSSAPRDRRVLLVVVALVIGVLAVSLVSALLPDVDAVLATLPIVVLFLVAGTALVLLRSVRGGRG
jgi:hypothetical protein